MIKVPVDDVVLPDWDWHYDNREEGAKLTASIMRHGQIQSLLVREVEGGYEIVDGRRRLNILRQTGALFVWVHNLGPVSVEEAIKRALSLELAAGINYAQLARVIGQLEGLPDFDSLPMTTPWTQERLRYFKTLTDFDWSQFDVIEQGMLWHPDPSEDVYEPWQPGDDEPAVAPAAVAAKVAAPKEKKAPAPARAVAVVGANDAAVRLAARAALAHAQPAAAPRDPLAPAPSAPVLVQMGEDFSVPEVRDWRPEPPPSLDGVKELELDFETTGLKWWAGDKPIGAAIRLPGGKKYYLPWGHKLGGNLDEEAVKRWFKTEMRGKRLTNANSRFDNHMAYVWGVDLEEQGNTWEDVQHFAALLDEYRKEFSINVLGHDYLGIGKTGQELDKTRMAEYHAGQVADYAMNDVELVYLLKQAMVPLMNAQELGRVRQLESDVIYPVCEMERNAANVDRALLKDWLVDSARMLQGMLMDVAADCGFQMNPDKSSDWVRLFDTFQIPYPGKTDKGAPSFADALLDTVEHPVIQLARRSGKLASLRSKFLIPYDSVIGEDQKLRFALHQLRGDEYGTARGRFSMSGAGKGIGQFGANLQQVFRVNSQREAFGFAYDDASHDHEIFLVRSLFKAEPYLRSDGTQADHLSADAQSIEYRLAAHFAEAPQLIEAYKADTEQLKRGELTKKWVDFHKVVGDVIRPYIDRSRNIIKNANFCLVYGGRENTLARTLGVQRAESDQIYKVWHRMFPELSALPGRAEKLARKRGYVKTILGRRARFTTAEHMQWAHAAINYVIQGSAADVMKTKLVELHKARKDTGLLMRMTVHDEVDGDARKPETAQRVREILNHQSFPELRVPIVWEVETGENWAVAH